MFVKSGTMQPTIPDDCVDNDRANGFFLNPSSSAAFFTISLVFSAIFSELFKAIETVPTERPT